MIYAFSFGVRKVQRLMLSNTRYFILTSITITAANSCKCVSNNNPNFKALEFLKAKFWPETLFLSCYDTSELLEFHFFFP